MESLKENLTDFQNRVSVLEREKSSLLEENRETSAKREAEKTEYAMAKRNLEEKLQNVINEVTCKEMDDEEVRKIVEEKNEIIAQLEERLMEEVGKKKHVFKFIALCSNFVSLCYVPRLEPPPLPFSFFSSLFFIL